MAKTGTTNRVKNPNGRGAIKQAAFASQGVKNAPIKSMAPASARALTRKAPATVSFKKNNRGQ